MDLYPVPSHIPISMFHGLLLKSSSWTADLPSNLVHGPPKRETQEVRWENDIDIRLFPECIELHVLSQGSDIGMPPTLRYAGTLPLGRVSLDQARSKRSRFMTLFHTAAKSCRNFS